jgi:PhnB protein
MPDRELFEQFDQVIDAILAGAPPPDDPELAALAQIASSLRDLPDEGFQKRLKSDLQRRATMITSAVAPVREGLRTVTPFIAVPNASELIDFLKRTFDAEETSRHPHGPDGLVAGVRIGDSDLIIMGGESVRGHERIGAFHVYVPDCDATFKRAVEAGATSMGEPSDTTYGERAGFVTDAAGNQWYIATHLGSTPALQGLWTVTPFVHPISAAKYIDFLATALGAQQLALYEHSGRGVVYAAVLIGDAVVEMGEPHERPSLPSSFYLYVEDCDAVYQSAIEAGATSLWPPTDQAWGDRTAGLVDPFGYQWMPSTRIKDVR